MGLALFLLCPGRAAFAQSGGTWLNLGVRASWFGATNATHSDHTGVGLAWRIGTSTTGWHPSIGFNWFETTLSTKVGGRMTTLGNLHVRPLMAGYGYTRKRGPLAVEVKAMVGYAFDSLSLDDSLRNAYLQASGSWVSGNVANGFVAKPEVNLWYDVAPRIGINVAAGYLWTRPDVTLHTATGATSQRFSADMVVLSVGVVYGIF
jgi:hypothetical protein